MTTDKKLELVCDALERTRIAINELEAAWSKDHPFDRQEIWDMDEAPLWAALEQEREDAKR